MSESKLSLELGSLDATRQLAISMAQQLELPQVIALNGTLGSGKTQWVRFVAQALGVTADEVTSPTYVLLQRYRGSCLIYHLDFYRLNSVAEVWDLGFDELLEQHALVLIEWAEKFPECLPPDHLVLDFSNANQQQSAQARQVEMSATGPQSQRLLQRAV
jgi:tRNA threonylcarbamoyladenosine biosynthesis protein TsaE